MTRRLVYLLLIVLSFSSVNAQDASKYMEEAKQGNAIAQYDLGVLYSKKNNIDQAIYWFKKAADQGLVNAQYNLGIIYNNKKNAEQATYWFKKAADQGNTNAQNNLGALYENSKNNSQAIYWYKKAAEKGLPIAQYNLALSYLRTNNVTEGITWFKKAAEKGHVQSQYYLGTIYGSTNNNEQAFTWYKKAAESGMAAAQYRLGLMYGEGIGVKQDYQLAKDWYSKAAAQGFAAAQSNLGILYLGNEKDGKLAESYLSKAAEQNILSAQKILTLEYCYGDSSIKKDSKKALYWLTKLKKNPQIKLLPAPDIQENAIFSNVMRAELIKQGVAVSDSSSIYEGKAALLRTSPDSSLAVYKIVQDTATTTAGEKGINISIYAIVSNMKSQKGTIDIYFEAVGLGALKSTNRRYSDNNGNVCLHFDYKPNSGNVRFIPLTQFMPYSELHLPKGNQTVQYQVVINADTTPTYKSDNYSFVVPQN